ncbi:MAG TPA: hypothetical protein VFO62_10595 [Candidatus Binatia bacterium]|nr:hypothetical protein [Candidatus Binatia bacterium]
MSNEPIFVTWMDANGHGPDSLALTLEHWPPPEVAAKLSHPELHTALHIVINATRPEIYACDVSAMVGGALMLHVETVKELHKRLGLWLEQGTGSP